MDDRLSSGEAKAKTVLVVEDDREVRECLADALESDGYRVFAAADGVEALAWLSDAHRSGAALPDVILLDLLVPRMDGLQFRALLRDDPTFDAIPVVALSGTSSVPPSQAPTFAGMLRKPVSLESLLATVRAHAS